MNALQDFLEQKGLKIKTSKEDYVEFYVLAKTGVKKERLEVSSDGELKACVRARPIEGEANKAIQKMIAKSWGLTKGQVELLKGDKSPHKLFRLSFSFTGDKGESYYREKISNSLTH